MRLCFFVLFFAVLLSGCTKSVAPKHEGEASVQASPASTRRSQGSPVSTASVGGEAPVGDGGGIRFSDVTHSSGIGFRHHTGGFGLKLLPETMGSGVAWIDYDGDGYPDLFLVNGRDWTPAEVSAYIHHNGHRDAEKYHFPIPPAPPHHRSTGALYHNNRDGTFTDVTKASGLDIEMQGMGVAVGDYDNDGKPDLYVTGYGRNYLFHNQGQGHFQEVAAQAGVQDHGFSTSAMWIDYDRDGKLDLFVCHYLNWTPQTQVGTYTKMGERVFDSPEQYLGEPSRLFHNEGGGKFSDVSKRAGILGQGAGAKAFQAKSKGLGVALCDYNNDDWPDIVVANDREPNFLFRNNKDGTFTEVGTRAGLSYSPRGVPRAGMGIDVADVDGSNRESVVITNFSNEMIGLYRNIGSSFVDVAPSSEIGMVSQPFLGFGCVFMDVDNDGWLDIMVANGHVNDLIEKKYGPRETYAERLLLFRNQSQVLEPGAPEQPGGALAASRQRFKEIGQQSGEGLGVPLVGRGLACADFNLDGAQDVLVTSNNGPPRLLRNDSRTTPRNNVVRVELQGTKSNRSGIGALVWAETGDRSLRRRVHSGSSYLSQNELPLTLGLGHSNLEQLVVRWPSGKLQKFTNLPSNSSLLINEDKGIVRKKSLEGPAKRRVASNRNKK